MDVDHLAGKIWNVLAKDIHRSRYHGNGITRKHRNSHRDHQNKEMRNTIIWQENQSEEIVVAFFIAKWCTKYLAQGFFQIFLTLNSLATTKAARSPYKVTLKLRELVGCALYTYFSGSVNYCMLSKKRQAQMVLAARRCKYFTFLSPKAHSFGKTSYSVSTLPLRYSSISFCWTTK